MSGTTIEPQAARSVVRIRVRFVETDAMGVVHHANYAPYMELARIEWLRRRGVSYASIASAGLHLAVYELSIRYRAPARFDDEIDIETHLRELGAASVRFDYRMVRVADRQLLAEGSTRLACVDDRVVLCRLTPEMVGVLTKPEQPT
jgi:acyl-CoA thioester hydrolase